MSFPSPPPPMIYCVPLLGWCMLLGSWKLWSSQAPSATYAFSFIFCCSHRLECSSRCSLVLTSLLFEANISASKAFLPSSMSSTPPPWWYTPSHSKPGLHYLLWSSLILLRFMGCPGTSDSFPVPSRSWVLVCPSFSYSPWCRENDQWIFRKKEGQRTALSIIQKYHLLCLGDRVSLLPKACPLD